MARKTKPQPLLLLDPGQLSRLTCHTPSELRTLGEGDVAELVQRIAALPAKEKS